MFKRMFTVLSLRLIDFNRLIGVVLVVVAGACVEPYPCTRHCGRAQYSGRGWIHERDRWNCHGTAITYNKVDAEGVPPDEKGATVSIRTASGDSFTLTEQDSGRYTADGLTIEADKTVPIVH
jgi:hypothetical protein